jgi:predicted RNA-binding protein with PIN domain
MIGAWPELRQDDLDKARLDLIDKLADYAGFSGDTVTCVFDGHLSGRPKANVGMRSNVTVVYTKSGETADQFIERMVDEKTAHLPRAARPIVKVATSDALEQSVVLSRGAVRVSALELRRDVLAAKRAMRKTLAQKAPVKPNMLGGRVDDAALKLLEELRGGGETGAGRDEL